MKKFAIPMAFLLLLAGQALAQPQTSSPPATGAEGSHFGWADVLRVDPVYDQETPSAPQQECYEEQVPAQALADVPGNNKRTVASVFGAIIGGLLGNRVGNGNGRVAATAAGAVAGGVVGNNLAAASEQHAGEPQYITQRHCRPTGAAATSRRVIAYEVEYRYRGDVYNSRLNYDPGDRMRVRVSVTPVE